jgi:predicted dinucleotide-binding enzyme
MGGIMKIGVLGTGMVGQALATKLVQLGHSVMMGSRTANNANASKWAKSNGANASKGSFADAALYGELLFNCTAGMASLEALRLAGDKNMDSKILVDVANPLDFSKGMPPSLSVCNTDSLGEQIQREFPTLRVVKSLNTVSSSLMVNPSLVPGEHDIFVCGNDDKAKKAVAELLKNGFGWKSVIDLGDISGARAAEMMMPMWLRLLGVTGGPNFNVRVVKKL